MQVGARSTSRAMWAVAVHPSLWTTALRQARRLARPGGWRRSPFLPLPDPDYLTFRLETQYGSDRAPEAADLVSYLRWCRDEDRAMRSRHARARR